MMVMVKMILTSRICWPLVTCSTWPSSGCAFTCSWLTTPPEKQRWEAACIQRAVITPPDPQAPDRPLMLYLHESAVWSILSLSLPRTHFWPQLCHLSSGKVLSLVLATVYPSVKWLGWVRPRALPPPGSGSVPGRGHGETEKGAQGRSDGCTHLPGKCGYGFSLFWFLC